MNTDQQEKKEYNDSPKLESFITKSKDGKYVIHKTVITHIKHVNYYEAILESTPRNDQADEEEVSA